MQKTRLGVDYGGARIGVAKALAGTTIPLDCATIVKNFPKKNTKPKERAKIERTSEAEAAHELIEIVRRENAGILYIGLPLLLSGEEGTATKKVRAFAGMVLKFAEREGLHIEVRFVDERLSTVSAHSMLSEVGIKRKNQKNIVDMQAAKIILQHGIDTEEK
jgi:putative Holliday junction resolvase